MLASQDSIMSAAAVSELEDDDVDEMVERRQATLGQVLPAVLGPILSICMADWPVGTIGQGTFFIILRPFSVPFLRRPGTEDRSSSNKKRCRGQWTDAVGEERRERETHRERVTGCIRRMAARGGCGPCACQDKRSHEKGTIFECYSPLPLKHSYRDSWSSSAIFSLLADKAFNSLRFEVFSDPLVVKKNITGVS